MSDESKIDNNIEKTASIKLTARQERSLNKALTNQKYRVINVVELIARDKILDMMDRMEMCTCSKCICDVLALALNSLPTKYVTSDTGKQYIKLETYRKQFETDIEIALMRACLIVKSAPNHDEQESKKE